MNLKFVFCKQGTIDMIKKVVTYIMDRPMLRNIVLSVPVLWAGLLVAPLSAWGMQPNPANYNNKDIPGLLVDPLIFETNLQNQVEATEAGNLPGFNRPGPINPSDVKALPGQDLHKCLEQMNLTERALKNSNPFWEEQLKEPNFKLEWDNCSKELAKEIQKIRREKNKAPTNKK